MAKNKSTKICTHCKHIKPLSDFYIIKSSQAPDSWCKICRREYVKAYANTPKGKQVHKQARQKYRESQHGRKRILQYRRTKRAKLARARRCKKYRLKNPVRIKIQSDVGHAVAAGRLAPAKSHACLLCGRQAQEYHHYLGYSEQARFAVVPLCKRCHKKTHSQGISFNNSSIFFHQTKTPVIGAGSLASTSC